MRGDHLLANAAKDKIALLRDNGGGLLAWISHELDSREYTVTHFEFVNPSAIEGHVGESVETSFPVPISIRYSCYFILYG